VNLSPFSVAPSEFSSSPMQNAFTASVWDTGNGQQRSESFEFERAAALAHLAPTLTHSECNEPTSLAYTIRIRADSVPCALRHLLWNDGECVQVC
jgi:hypothetical protein